MTADPHTLRLTLHVWRQPDRASRGKMVDLPGHGRVDPRLVPRDARHPQRAADRAGRGAGRVRSRLPRGHLRHVLADDQRPPARRQAARPRPASSTCGSSSDGDEIWIEPWRAHAFPVIKDLCVDRSAFDRVIAARRLHHRQLRLGARRQRHPGPQGPRRARDGRRRLHRLRRVRRRLPQRLGDAVRRRQARPPPPAAAGPARARPPHARRWCRRWTPPGSATARTTTSARPRAPRTISRDVIARDEPRLRARRAGLARPRGQGRRRGLSRHPVGDAREHELRSDETGP